MVPGLTRRRFLKSTGALGLGATLGCASTTQGLVPPLPLERVRVLSIGVVGTIGGHDRQQVAAHPRAEIVGLCDVDEKALAAAAGEHPEAFTCSDYRVAFRDHAAEFDAVIVSTPDHTHAPIILAAMAAGKHVYGQKPLVHQLEELARVQDAVLARPGLVTQVGNQRMAYPGRRAAVEILRSGRLGPALEAHAWTGSPDPSSYFNFEADLTDPIDPPDGFDWDLWLGPCAEQPFRDKLAPVKWRSWWDFGTGGLGDWGVHVLDVLFYAYDELDSPMSVMTHAPVFDEHFHPHPCRSTVTYAVEKGAFARGHFPVHYADCNQPPSRASLGLPPGPWADSNMTVVVCEGGVLTLTAGGGLEVWQGGVMTPGLEMSGLPEFPAIDHWHAWIDTILGREAELWTPFADGVRITECALLAVKAARFPGRELAWDRGSLSFLGDSEATDTIVRRDYRTGFGLTPVV